VLDVASLEPFFKSASSVACHVLSDLVRYVDALARPSLAFRLTHLLHYHHVMPKMKQISCSRTPDQEFEIMNKNIKINKS
jgi:glycine cleavage system regulatory protein